jgi:glycosyltransferase involved in cell wall biosynthesis
MTLSILILTHNEEKHIERCLTAIHKFCTEIFVVDSSTDSTSNIVGLFTNNIYKVNAMSFSEKFNWALYNIDFKTEWILRLDADELISENNFAKLLTRLEKTSQNVSGIFIRRQLWFLGKFIRFGGLYPVYSIRVWRKGCVVCESRYLDEHLILTTGVPSKMNVDIIDYPLVGINGWISKHNEYAIREVMQIELNNSIKNDSGKQHSNRFSTLKLMFKRIYYNLPLFIRPFLIFFIRYFFLFGFLDGLRGLIWHVMHTFWYRFIIDINLFEIKQLEKNKKKNKK